MKKYRNLAFAGVANLALLAPASAAVGLVFDSDFGTFEDGNLSTQNGWESQASWLVEGGNAQNHSNFSRARNFANFRPEVGESVKITLTDVYATGTATNATYLFGFAAGTEHTGATTPQVAASLTFGTGTLSVGGATDTAYNLGEISSDLVNITLLFTRTASDTWSLSSTIENTTDETSFTGAAEPRNDNGSAGTDETPSASRGITAGAFLDAAPGNSVRYGMRGFSGSDVDNILNIGGVKVEVIPEPSALLLSLFGCVALLRRRRA